MDFASEAAAKDAGRIPNVGIFFTLRMKKWS